MDLGGGGNANNADCCAAEWVASVAACLSDIYRFVTSLASINAAESELPFFKELRHEYHQLQLARQRVADHYAVLDKAQYYSFDGTVKSKFHPKGLPPATALPSSVSSFVDASRSNYKVPAQRTLSKICHHDAWRRLFADCCVVDEANDAAGNSAFIDRECSRLISCGADHSGDWLDVLPTSEHLQSDKFTVALQRRLGLYISAGVAYFDTCEADGWVVGESDRLGDGLAHAANHSSAHKWICAAWRDAEAAATMGSVYLGDKKLGLLRYSQFNATYIPDIINVTGGDDGRPYLDEIKNYSCFVTKTTTCPAAATLNGGRYAFGNTEEPLKWRVLGTRARGVPAMGSFDHTNGAGFVAPHQGDYSDAIANCKATVNLLVHEATLGGMSPYAARHLRRLGRDAVASGVDGTDYTRSFTARSFVPHFGQPISTACVMYGAEGILKGIRKNSHGRLRRAVAGA